MGILDASEFYDEKKGWAGGRSASRYLLMRKKRIFPLLLGLELAGLVLCLCLLFADRRPAHAPSPSSPGTVFVSVSSPSNTDNQGEDNKDNPKKDYIKWVDFNVSYQALEKCYAYDVASQEEPVKLDWIDLLAYLGVKYGGNFPEKVDKELNKLVERLKSGESTMEELTKDMKYYSYYHEAYEAVLGGMVGEYEIETADEADPTKKQWVKKYGLKAFSPIARYYEYVDYDDFGAARSYGFKRTHLGHDMMGQVGTPVVAVESGYVEAIGWNQYGGWRLGIRSFDGRRYYYYAHLRKNFPYNKSLKEGSVVTAGDVIGYLGRTGYSATENTNNIDTPHLHFGLQLIFDESQKEGNNEIWIDCYDLIRFLSKHRCETVKNVETKEYFRVYEMKDPAVEEYMTHETKKEPAPAADPPARGKVTFYE